MHGSAYLPQLGRDEPRGAASLREGRCAEYARWLGQGTKYAHAAAHFGMYVFAPVYGTADFDPGVSPYVGHAVWLEAHVQDPALYRPSQDRAAGGRMGALTPALLLNTVLPLLIIVLGCGMFAGERARGTWRLASLYARGFFVFGSKQSHFTFQHCGDHSV